MNGVCVMAISGLSFLNVHTSIYETKIQIRVAKTAHYHGKLVFYAQSTIYVMLGHAGSIATCGSQTHTEVTTCAKPANH